MIDISIFSPEDPPNTLFKYISQVGLLGIFNSNVIWATDIFYMNDAAEYNHAVHLIQKQVSERLDSIPKGLVSAFPTKEIRHDRKAMERIFLTIVQRTIGNLSNFHIFVCSFTEESDLLSQWRGYCPKGSGFSIGFKSSMLINTFEKMKYKLVKCIYDTKKQTKIIDDLLQKSIDKIPEEEVDDSVLFDILTPISNELFNAFFQIAPMFKDPSFFEEKEWRFVSRAIEFGSRNVKYRQGVSMIIPYYEIKILTDDNIIPVETIVIGPTQNPELSKESIRGLLKTKGNEKVSILSSKTPYREW
jgi:hypothetical protein